MAGERPRHRVLQDHWPHGRSRRLVGAVHRRRPAAGRVLGAHRLGRSRRWGLRANPLRGRLGSAGVAGRMSRRHIVRHGTYNEYQNYGCRCDDCRHACGVYQANYRRERAARLGPCGVSGCDRGQHAKGLCRAHYERLRVTGRVGDATIAGSSVRDGELRCSTCQEWLPDTEFPRSSAEPQRRGRHFSCRPCNTELRRAHRAKMSEAQREAVRARDRERKAEARRAA